MAVPLAGLEFTKVIEYGFLAVIAGYAFTGLVAPLWGPRATRLSLYAATMIALAAALYCEPANLLDPEWSCPPPHPSFGGAT